MSTKYSHYVTITVNFKLTQNNQNKRTILLTKLNINLPNWRLFQSNENINMAAANVAR